MLAQMYDARRKILLTVLWLHLCVATVFTVIAFSAPGVCYLLPCDKADGFSLMTSVNPGTSFTVVATGFALIAHGVYGVWMATKGCSTVAGGGYTGATLVVIVLALQAAVQWGSLAGLLRVVQASIGMDLDLEVYIVNPSAVRTFKALSILGAVECAVVGGALAMIVVTRDLLWGMDDASGGRTKMIRHGSAYATYQSVETDAEPDLEFDI